VTCLLHQKKPATDTLQERSIWSTIELLFVKVKRRNENAQRHRTTFLSR
jgi:hypothetical protein